MGVVILAGEAVIISEGFDANGQRIKKNFVNNNFRLKLKINKKKKFSN